MMDERSDSTQGRGREQRVVIIRFRIRQTGSRYVGECLEAGLHVEAPSREEARHLLDDAYRAWDQGIAMLENDGKRWEFSRVPFYTVQRVLFDLSAIVEALRPKRPGRQQRDNPKVLEGSTSRAWTRRRVMV